MSTSWATVGCVVIRVLAPGGAWSRGFSPRGTDFSQSSPAFLLRCCSSPFVVAVRRCCLSWLILFVGSFLFRCLRSVRLLLLVSVSFPGPPLSAHLLVVAVGCLRLCVSFPRRRLAVLLRRWLSSPCFSGCCWGFLGSSHVASSCMAPVGRCRILPAGCLSSASVSC